MNDFEANKPLLTIKFHPTITTLVQQLIWAGMFIFIYLKGDPSKKKLFLFFLIYISYKLSNTLYGYTKKFNITIDLKGISVPAFSWKQSSSIFYPTSDIKGFCLERSNKGFVGISLLTNDNRLIMFTEHMMKKSDVIAIRDSLRNLGIKEEAEKSLLHINKYRILRYLAAPLIILFLSRFVFWDKLLFKGILGFYIVGVFSCIWLLQNYYTGMFTLVEGMKITRFGQIERKKYFYLAWVGEILLRAFFLMIPFVTISDSLIMTDISWIIPIALMISLLLTTRYFIIFNNLYTGVINTLTKSLGFIALTIPQVFFFFSLISELNWSMTLNKGKKVTTNLIPKNEYCIGLPTENFVKFYWDYKLCRKDKIDPDTKVPITFREYNGFFGAKWTKKKASAN